MANGYKTIKIEGQGEIVEKKSRFIGIAVHVNDEAEAAAFIESQKKKYYDARHNCWAYVLGDSGETVRASDDGEPQGTAGRPILETITHAGLTYTCVVVTRYFGGTLLGTGGLVKAYTQASEAALSAALIVQMMEACIFTVQTDYNGSGKLQYYFGQSGIHTISSDYGQDVKLTAMCEAGEYERVIKKITDLTSGRAGITLSSRKFCEFI